jgi:hypothetical protein
MKLWLIQSFRVTWMCHHFRWHQAIENEENRKLHKGFRGLKIQNGFIVPNR